MAKVERAEFRNATTGYVGAVRLEPRCRNARDEQHSGELTRARAPGMERSSCGASPRPRRAT